VKRDQIIKFFQQIVYFRNTENCDRFETKYQYKTNDCKEMKDLWIDPITTVVLPNKIEDYNLEGNLLERFKFSRDFLLDYSLKYEYFFDLIYRDENNNLNVVFDILCSNLPFEVKLTIYEGNVYMIDHIYEMKGDQKYGKLEKSENWKISTCDQKKFFTLNDNTCIILSYFVNCPQHNNVDVIIKILKEKYRDTDEGLYWLQCDIHKLKIMLMTLLSYNSDFKKKILTNEGLSQKLNQQLIEIEKDVESCFRYDIEDNGFHSCCVFIYKGEI
jgi:hypothetical protein